MSVSDAAEEVSPSPSSGTSQALRQGSLLAAPTERRSNAKLLDASSTASGTGRTVADAGVGAASGALPAHARLVRGNAPKIPLRVMHAIEWHSYGASH
eukprot:1129210-Amphidinium_carterae.1